jgi:transaldolase
VFASLAGAAYVAPYLGRLTDLGADGLSVIARMQALLDRYGSHTRLLVASVRSREDVLALLELGVGALTLPPELFGSLLDNPATIKDEASFLADARLMR